MSKILVLVLYIPRIRSPLGSMFYERLKGYEDEKIKFIVFPGSLYSTQHLLDVCDGVMPDYIFQGFGKQESPISLTMFANFILSNNIKVIVESGDPNVLLQTFMPTWSCIITHVLHRMPKDWPLFDQLWAEYPHVKSVHVPWGIDLETYKDLGMERNFDVTMVCSVGKQWKWHDKRREFSDMVMKGLDDITDKVGYGNAYGGEYISILNQTKMNVVETSGRQALVQKFVESAACGCLMIGDMPYGQGKPGDLIEDGKTFVEVKTAEEIPDKVKYYLAHPEERIEMTKEARRRVEKKHDIDKVVKDFIQYIINDHAEGKE